MRLKPAIWGGPRKGARCLLLAHHALFSLLRMAASGQSRHKIFGRPRAWRGSRSISRPSDRSTEPASGLGPFGSRSLRQEHRRTYATPASTAQQLGLEPCLALHAAPWQPHQLISGRAQTARTKILHTRGSLAPRWMGLVSRTADKANPTSSVTHPSRLWPGSVGQTHLTDQAVTIAPVGTLPVSTYRQRAITSLRASAMIMMRRTRPFRSPTRL
jgi:hypothetical protein